MVAFKSFLAAASVAVFAIVGVQADHWITVVNGCKTQQVTPTLVLTSGSYSGSKQVPLSTGQTTVFKLTDNGQLTGLIYNAANGSATSGSQLQFGFAPSGDSVPAFGTYALSNFFGYSIPTVAVSWPNTNTCQTRRCYSHACDATQAVGEAVKDVSAILGATSSCVEANTGITLYYCSAQ